MWALMIKDHSERIGLRVLQVFLDDKVTQFEDPVVRTLNDQGQREKGV
jgi:hypothetical protein